MPVASQVCIKVEIPHLIDLVKVNFSQRELRFLFDDFKWHVNKPFLRILEIEAFEKVKECLF